MHPYFLRFNQSSGLWQPPPLLRDVAWIEAFEYADDIQKRNLASHWLWLLNKEVPDYPENRLIAWLAPYSTAYAKFASHYDVDLFKSSKLNGSIDMFFDSKHGPLYSVPNRNEFQQVFTSFWRSENKVLSMFDPLLAFLRNENTFGRQQELCSFYPVLLQQLWEQSQKVGPDQDAWYDLTVFMAAICGIHSLNPDDPTDSPVKDGTIHSWHKLSYLVRYNEKERKADKLNSPLLPAIQSTKPAAAVKAFDLILAFSMRSFKSGHAQLEPAFVLNEGNNVESNLYPMLRTWIPALTSTWDAAESVDLHYAEAFSMYLQSQKVSPDIALPGELNINP